MNPYSGITEIRKSELSDSQRKLQEAYLKLAKERPYMDIPVKKLCERAGVARTTFYASYRNTDELLEEIEDSLIFDLLKVNDQMKDHASLADSGGDLFYSNMREFVARNQDELRILLVDRPDARLTEKWKTAVKYHFWEVLPESSGERNDFVLEIIASLAVSIYTYLIKNPEQAQLEGRAVIQTVIHAIQKLNY